MKSIVVGFIYLTHEPITSYPVYFPGGVSGGGGIPSSGNDSRVCGPSQIEEATCISVFPNCGGDLCRYNANTDAAACVPCLDATTEPPTPPRPLFDGAGPSPCHPSANDAAPPPCTNSSAAPTEEFCDAVADFCRDDLPGHGDCAESRVSVGLAEQCGWFDTPPAFPETLPACACSSCEAVDYAICDCLTAATAAPTSCIQRSECMK